MIFLCDEIGDICYLRPMRGDEPTANHEAAKPSALKKLLSIALRVGVSGGIIFYIFWKMQREKIESLGGRSELDVFWEQLTGAHLGWILATVGCFGLTCFMGIVRWYLLLGVQGLKLGLVRTGQIFFVGQFFNSFMLGGTGGDVIKATYAAKETHSKKAEAVMTVFLDRLIGMIGLVATTFLMMAFNWRFVVRPEVLPYTATVGGLLVIIIVAFVVAVIPGAGRGIPFAEKFLRKFKLYEQVEKMVRAYRVYTGHKTVIGWTLLLSVGIHFTLIFAGLCLAKAVDIGWDKVSVGKYFLLVPIINCVTALPVTIAGLGLREKMYMDLFKLALPVGVAEEVLSTIGTKAVAMSLLTYGTLLFWSLFGAIVFLAYKHRAHHERLA
jgi:uncharacterized membrane protein YbhN (UPF0104 family)